MDAEERLFETRRFCFLGSIDDWMTIGDQDALPTLVKTYVQHLGEDSFLRLVLKHFLKALSLRSFAVRQLLDTKPEWNMTPFHANPEELL